MTRRCGLFPNSRGVLSWNRMNRFAATLSLIGLVLLLVGLFMMLRFLFPPLVEGMWDQMSEISPDQKAALRHAAGRDIFCAYVLLLASGLGLACAGVAMVIGRARIR